MRYINMRTYEAVFKEGETEGIYALSVVDDPAMEDLWITLSKHPEQIEFAKADEKKRLLLGAALIPNKKIYRNMNGEEFYMVFSEQTIEKLAHNFFKQQNNNNSSLEHEVKLNGMSVVEGWIVEDSEKDKSANFGKKYPKGTFVTMMKVDNDEMWEKVENGEIKGFSIDAILGLQEVNFNKQLDMNEEVKKSIVSEVIDGVKALFQKEVQEEAVEAVEETVAEETVEATDRDFDVEALKAEILEIAEQNLSKQVNEMKEAHKSELEAKTKEIETLKTELSKQLEVETVKDVPVELKQEQKGFNYGENRPTSIFDRVFASFNE